MNEIVMSSELLQRLAGSLLHFVWQGALFAFVAVIVLRLMARRSAESRYAAAVVTMGLMIAAPVFTFVFYAETGGATLRAMQLLRASITDMAHSGAGPGALRWATWIVAIWALGVGACSIRLIAGWFLSLRIIRAAKEAVPPLAAELLERVRRELLERRTVRLLVGKKVDTPVVFGWIRPIILLPATAVTGLTEDQLLAVLAHELAHIRRHDFLVNTLQRTVECILFYHPAVWWISGRIRVERERCCDDLAVRVCGDRMAYAEALIALERTRSAETALAVAATGGSVTDRVRRILGSRNAHWDWQSAVAALLFVVILSGAGMWQPSTLASSTVPPAPEYEPVALVQKGPEPPAATPLDAIVAIATAQAVRPAQQPESRPAQPSQVTHPVIAPSREAARDRLGQLRVEYSADSYVKQAAEGDTIAVETFLMAGMNINARDTAGFTALVKAAQAKQTETVQALLAAGANPDLIASWEFTKKGDTNTYRQSHSALSISAENGDLATMKVLLAGGATVNLKAAGTAGTPTDTALTLAASRGHADLVDLLLDSKAAIDGIEGDGKPILMAACSIAGSSTLQILVKRGANVNIHPDSWTPALVCAATYHDIDSVRSLLDRGAEINAREANGRTALHSALSVGNEVPARRERGRRTALLLIERGADINVQTKGNPSETPLRAAVRSGLTEVVRTLLDKGADIKGADNIGNLLFDAISGAPQGKVSTDHTATVVLLVERGADVNGKRNGDTPLGSAVKQRQTEIVRALLTRGADPNIPNSARVAFPGPGRGAATPMATLLELASGHAEITQLLLDAGAKP